MEKFYITTSIAYTNAKPHIGFALELIQADVIARHRRFMGDNVFFLTGTDEHGMKIAKKAKENGKTPQEFCDEISDAFLNLTKTLNISNDDFIRTTDKQKHWPGVYKLWRELRSKGDIYEKDYEGLYCVGCEAFILEKDLIDGKCQYHDSKPEKVKEKNYFFKLSKYSKEIESNIENNVIKIAPVGRKKEMLSFLRDGLEDVSFSRPKEKVGWGIPVPDDELQSIYCWADALTNYISALGYGREEDNFKKYWPAEVQCLGKDIQKFHILIWQGMLLSLGMKLPKQFLVHGFLTVDGRKMSKSLGNVVDPFDLIEKYGTDAVRYYFLREISPTEDGDFSDEKFKERYNSELAGGLGNLTARIITLFANFYEDLSPLQSASQADETKKTIAKAREEMNESLKEFKFNKALSAIWELISYCDKLIDDKKPWEKERGGRKEIISELVFALGEIANLLIPFMPETSEKIMAQIKSAKSAPLFRRIP